MAAMDGTGTTCSSYSWSRTNYGSHRWSPRTIYGCRHWSRNGGTSYGKGGPVMAAISGPGGLLMAAQTGPGPYVAAITGPPSANPGNATGSRG